MSNAKPIDYGDVARSQLEAIVDHIADQGQPQAARTLLIRFSEVVDALSRFPLCGHRYASSHPRLQNIRIIGIPGYSVMIYHQVTDQRVLIHAVLDGHRGPQFVQDTLRRSQ